jgi:hypothetical protein
MLSHRVKILGGLGMKKLLPFVVFLVILLTVAREASATTTIYFGRTLGGSEMVADATMASLYSHGLNNSVFNFTYIKKIELVIDYQKGETNYYWPCPLEYGNVKIGYPILEEKNGLIFITGGYQNLKRENLTEARGFMMGVDLIVVASDDFYAELDLQYSIFGAIYRRIYPSHIDCPMDQITFKLKTQFILSDHFGLVANVQWLKLDVNNGLITEELFTPSFGIVYRF